jgi:hypothetical protein
VVPATAQRKANLSHSSTSIRSLCRASTPGTEQAVTRRSAPPAAEPGRSPSTTRAGPPLCSTTPGSLTVDEISTRPPSTRSGPSTRASSAALPIPFCSDATTVVSWHSPGSSAAVEAVS